MIRKYFPLIAVLGVLCQQVSAATASTKKPTQCKFWHALAANISNLHRQTDVLHLGCSSSCDDIRCSGHISHIPMIEVLHLDKPFCFGVKLNHCSHPVSMDYYLVIPSQNISINDSVTHDDTMEVKGPVGTTIVLRVKMVKVNSTHVLFGITGGVKVTFPFANFPVENEQVFPETYIDVPPCTANDPQKTMSAFSPPDVCTESNILGTTTMPPAIKIKSETLDKTCEFGLWQCSTNEQCEATKENTHARDGKCACDGKSHFSSSTGMCEPIGHFIDSTTIKALITPKTSPVNGTNPSGQTKKDKNMIPIIVGGVVGGLLLIVVVVSIVIYLGRRRRMAMYRGRQQLLTDDIDDDDDDMHVVI